MASSFLESLKNAVEQGDFNSEAAKKINQIDSLADTEIDAEEKVDERLKAAGIRTVSEKETIELNSEYEKKMLEIKEKDVILQQIKTLTDIEETVMLSIYDMKDFVETLEDTFDKTRPINNELFAAIDAIRAKYKGIINN